MSLPKKNYVMCCNRCGELTPAYTDWGVGCWKRLVFVATKIGEEDVEGPLLHYSSNGGFCGRAIIIEKKC